MTGWRRDLSTYGLVIAALLTAAGYAFAFTQFGANLVFASWGLALLSLAVYPTWRRLIIAAGVALFFFYYAGAMLLLGLGTYEAIRATGRHMR